MVTDEGRKDWVFVTGCARAWTTVAGILLNHHPDCCIFNESGFVRDFLSAKASGSPTTIVNMMMDGARWTKEDVMTWDPTGGENVTDACLSLRSLYPGYSVFGDKIPWAIEYWEIIRSVLPSSKFIVMERPRDEIVASCERCSELNENFRSMYAAWGTEKIDRGIRLIDGMRGKDGVLCLKHCEMQSDPRTFIGRMLDFVSLGHSDYNFDEIERYFVGPQFVSTPTPRLSYHRRRIYDITKRRRSKSDR